MNITDSQDHFFSKSIFYIDTEKIKPNPYQPRREFNEARLNELADSIKQYGVLQPLVVTRREVEKEDGGLAVEYELIAGERRLRASKIAGVAQVPAVIRSVEDDDRVKLEIAIIENLQREDLNPVDRAVAFKKLVDEFGFKHTEIAKKIGKSREYVSNSIRLLSLPQDILDYLSAGKITEGHTRPLLMLIDKPEEQSVLFKEIILKKMTVREAEHLARRTAYDKVRKKELMHDPELMEIEDRLTEVLGTKVYIDKRGDAGRVMIDFFTNEDLRKILNYMQKDITQPHKDDSSIAPESNTRQDHSMDRDVNMVDEAEDENEDIIAAVDREDTIQEDPTENDDELYSLKNFSI